MQVTETLSEGLRRGFAVTVPAATIEAAAQKKFADISKTLALPGFRPGRVPMNIVRKRFAGSVLAEVMQAELDRASGAVIEERGLRPAGQPRVSFAGEPPRPDSGVAADLSFSLEMDLLPEIAVPAFEQLAFERLHATPDPAKVDAALARMAKFWGKTSPIEDRGAESGDELTVDFTGTIGGLPFQGGAGSDVVIDVGGGGFIPGFAEALAGIRPGESREAEATFPADYAVADLAGRAAVFAVTAKKLESRELAAIDDALADRLGFGTLVEMREYFETQQQRELDGLARLRLKRQLLDALAERATFEAPPTLLETEFQAIWRHVEHERAHGHLDEEDRDKDEATLRAEYRAIAERRVRLGLLLAEIGRGAGVTVEEAELTQALRAELGRYPGREKEVVEHFRNTPGAYEQLRGPIFEEKTVDHILSRAQVTERQVTPAELEAAAADGGAGPLSPTATLAAPAAETTPETSSDPAPPAGLEPEAPAPMSASPADSGPASPPEEQA